MSRFFAALIIFSLLFLSVEFYAFQALKTITKNKYIRIVWILVALAIYINLFYVLFSTPRTAGQTKAFQMALGLLLTFFVPKFVMLLVMFGEDLVRVILKAIFIRIFWANTAHSKQACVCV